VTGLPGPVAGSPVRRPGSVRRTSSFDVCWPDGREQAAQLTGRARDLLTPGDGGPARALAEQVIRVRAARDRTIESLAADPPVPRLAELVGAGGGRGYRARLADLLPAERRAGALAYLLLDDLAPVTLVAGVAFVMLARLRGEAFKIPVGRSARGPRIGVCSAYRPGSAALEVTADGHRKTEHDFRLAAPLVRADDPDGWHQLLDSPGLSMRRARRIDVYADDGLRVDSMFQDSVRLPDGQRFAVHEYRVSATIDPRSGELASVTAEPRVLPYGECVLAAGNAGRLAGTAAAELRDIVLALLPGIDGCTHLNDALRALAEVPVLAALAGLR
jgi:Protein of unknown function (DUF2889)